MFVYHLSFLRHPLRKSTRSDSHKSVRPGFALGDASHGCGRDSGAVLSTVQEWLETSLPLIEFALQGKQVRRMRHSFRTQLRSYEEGPGAVNAGYAVPTSRTMATSCRTISAHGEWEGHGETITRRMFKPFTGGATEKRDPGETESRFCDVP